MEAAETLHDRQRRASVLPGSTWASHLKPSYRRRDADYFVATILFCIRVMWLQYRRLKFMKVIRIWFVALLLAVTLREKSVLEIRWDPEYVYEPQGEDIRDDEARDMVKPQDIPIPVMEWRSMLDQKTGLWKASVQP